jgi:hypothetical protein
MDGIVNNQTGLYQRIVSMGGTWRVSQRGSHSAKYKSKAKKWCYSERQGSVNPIEVILLR